MISKEQIKFIRSLHQKKFRDEHQLFIIEGAKMIEEALIHAPSSIQHVYGLEENYEGLPAEVNYSQITQKTLERISLLKHPQRYLALCSYLPKSMDNPDFLIALDTVQDPGNLGTILRLAAWFGVTKIVASRETADCYNPKVVQASMGAIFHVDVEYINLQDFFKETTLPVYGALLEGENVYSQKLVKKGILLMGNEGNGISDELIPYIQNPLTIPKFGQGESLNVAIATTVFLSEFSRGN